MNLIPCCRSFASNPVGALALITLLLAAPTTRGATDAAAPQAGQTARQMTTDWPQFQRGPGRHGYNPHETVLSPANVAQIELLWSRSTGPHLEGVLIKASPVVSNGLVYVVKSHPTHGRLIALDAASGAARWSRPAGSTDRCGATPAVAYGQVYLPSLNSMTAYDAASGTLRWRSRGSAFCDPEWTPAVVSGKVFAVSHTSSTFVESRSASTGAVLWRRAVCTPGGTCASVFAPSAMASGIVYVANYIGVVFAYSARDGRLLWNNMVALAVSAPVATAEAVYVAAADERLYALDAKTGAVLWSTLVGLQVNEQAPALADGIVYLGSFQGMTAVDARTGTMRWHQPAVGKVVTPPAVANGVVYFGAADGKLYALHSRTGAVLFSRQVADVTRPLGAPPVVVDGVIYFGTADKLFAFGLPNAGAAATPR